MNSATAALRKIGGIDCDVHLPVPEAAILPYLPEYWRDTIVSRGIDGLELTSMRPDSGVQPYASGFKHTSASDFIQNIRRDVFDAYNTTIAIAHCLHGSQILLNEDLSSVLVTAVNEWVRNEWLDKEPRLRSSILVPVHSPEKAAAEIYRLASDRRFVQVLLPSSANMPLGKRFYWPIYEAAAKHGLPVGIHAGGANLQAPTAIGWPNYFVEDYIGQSITFQSQLMSLVSEGVFSKFPLLRVICIESGFTWLPGFMWRMNKLWRAMRGEIPWVDRPPAEILREHVRFTIQPINAPSGLNDFDRVLSQVGGDEFLLFSTDYPHVQFPSKTPLPAYFSEQRIERIAKANPMSIYSRLGEE